jgi:membrane protein YqaA with SNARE-associated domain
MLLAFLWGLAEATFFFIVPDVFLSLVAILGGWRTWRHILAAIFGALLGGALLFQWAKVNPARAHASVARVPFIRESMFSGVVEGLRRHGLSAVFFGSITGIPYKLYAVEAPRYFSQSSFLLATPPARAVRFLVVWFAFCALAGWLRKCRNWHTWQLVGVYAAVWIAVYGVYWGRILSG